MKRVMAAMAGVAMALVVAAPAQADRDINFANELHTYGIYGQKDFNAWIAKITCKRQHKGVDTDAYQSADFIFNQLQTGSTTEQSWQFLGAALRTYCPELLPILDQAAR